MPRLQLGSHEDGQTERKLLLLVGQQSSCIWPIIGKDGDALWFHGCQCNTCCFMVGVRVGVGALDFATCSSELPGLPMRQLVLQPPTTNSIASVETDGSSTTATPSPPLTMSAKSNTKNNSATCIYWKRSLPLGRVMHHVEHNMSKSFPSYVARISPLHLHCLS